MLKRLFGQVWPAPCHGLPVQFRDLRDTRLVQRSARNEVEQISDEEPLIPGKANGCTVFRCAEDAEFFPLT